MEAMEEVDMEEGEDMKTNVSKCWKGICEPLMFSSLVATPTQHQEQRRSRPDLGPHRHRLRDSDPAARGGGSRGQLGSLPDHPDEGTEKFPEREGRKYPGERECS